MTLLNHNTIHLTCKLSFITSVQLLKRFYPGKELIRMIGSHPSKNLVEMLKTFEGKKQLAIAYHEFLSKIFFGENSNGAPRNTTTFQFKNDLDNYCVTSNKAEILLSTSASNIKVTNKTSILNQITPLNLENSKPQVKNTFSFLMDEKIPATNWTKLLLLEQINPAWISTGFTRGFIFESFLTYMSEFTGNPYILNKFIIHVAMARAGVDFMSELVVASHHEKFMEKMQKLKIMEINMLSKNKPGSENYINSIKHTGQSDCDIKLVLQRTDDHTQYSLYMDIKQKELDPINDMKFLYLKTNYNLTGKNAFGILDNPAYAQTYIDMCIVNLGNIDNIKEVSAFLSEMNKFNNIKDQLLYLYEFILLNVNKHPSIQMAVMCTVDIEPTNKVYQGPSEEYVSKMPDDVLTNPKSFDKFSKDIYKRFLEMNSNDSSKTSHIENIKKRLMNDKVFKPHFVTNKDYYDIEDK